MEITPYVKVSVTLQEHGRRETQIVVWSFDMPRVQYDYPHTSKRIRWIISRFQYFNPKKDISSCYSFYDKKTGIDLDYKAAFTKLSAAKGQVTKIEKAIEAAKQKFEPTLFLKKLEDTDEYRRAIEKLNAAKAQVFEYTVALEDELKSLHEQ